MSALVNNNSFVYGSNFVMEALEERLNHLEDSFGQAFPCDEIREYFLDFCYGVGIDLNNTAKEIVDNAIINGDHGYWSEFFDSEKEAKKELKSYEKGQSEFLFACVSKQDNQMYFVKHF